MSFDLSNICFRPKRRYIEDAKTRDFLRHLCEDHLGGRKLAHNKKGKVKEKKLTSRELDEAQKRFVDVLKPDSDEKDQDKIREFYFLATFVFARILPLPNTPSVHLPPRGNLQRCLARFLMLFTGRDAMSTALPMKIHPDVEEFILSFEEEAHLEPACAKRIENVCPELIELVHTIKQTVTAQACVMVLQQNLASFLRIVIQRVQNLDESYESCDSASEEALKPYDPSTGAAYYFTDTGGQLRNLPRFGSELICPDFRTA